MKNFTIIAGAAFGNAWVPGWIIGRIQPMTLNLLDGNGAPGNAGVASQADLNQAAKGRFSFVLMEPFRT